MTGTVLDALRRHPLVSRFEEPRLRALAAASYVRRLGRGQVLFLAGERSDALYIVVAGRLRVVVTSQHGDELVLSLVGAGESVGDLSVLDGAPRSADVDAAEAAELVVVPADQLRAALLDRPEVLLQLTQQLAADVRRLTETAADLVFLDVRRRLAKLLVVQVAGDESASAVNQSGLGARLGVTRQSVNRAMGELARRGWIALDGSRVRLLDRDALERFAGS